MANKAVLGSVSICDCLPDKLRFNLLDGVLGELIRRAYFVRKTRLLGRSADDVLEHLGTSTSQTTDNTTNVPV